MSTFNTPAGLQPDRSVHGLPPVDRILLTLTTSCNLSCGYCYQNVRKPRRAHASALQSCVRLALSQGAGRTNLVFSGGEPLLEFDRLRTVVEYAEENRTSEKALRYWLVTNGLLLTDDVADFLQAHRFRVQLSFDGVAAAQDHRGKNTFEILDRLLDSLRRRQQDLFRRLQIAMTVIPPTVRHMANSVEYFLQKGAHELSIAPSLTHSPGWATEDIAELDRQFAEISNLCRHHLDRSGEVPVRILRKDEGSALRGYRMRRLCGGLRGSSLAVDVDGHLYGCPLFAESCQQFPPGSLMTELKALRMGDVRDPALPERRAAAIRAADRLVPENWSMRRYSSYGRCGDCRYRAGCFICPVSIWSKPDDGDMFRVPDFVCAFNKVALKYREGFPYAPGEFSAMLGSDGTDPGESPEAGPRPREGLPAKPRRHPMRRRRQRQEMKTRPTSEPI
jgi:sulfatase maturation enzyme AslB (radical SAM superfamily)